MKLSRTIPTVLAAALCLSACGKVDDFGKKDQNATLTTTSAATAEPAVTEPTESEEDIYADITTIIPDVVPDNNKVEAVTKIPETTTKKTTTTAEEITTQIPDTTAAPQTSEPDANSTEPEPEPDLPDAPTAPSEADEFADSIRVVYNDFVFGLGDRMSETEGFLGEQATSSGIVISNLSPNDIADEYYFYGMTVQAKNDVIFSIELADNGFYGDARGCTVGGISLDSGRADIEGVYGAPSRFDDFNVCYEVGGQSLQVTFGGDGYPSKILITDKNI